MHKITTAVVALTMALLTAHSHASDWIQGEYIVVKPSKNGRFETGSYGFVGADLFGYIGGLRDLHKLTALLLRDSGKATDEQKHQIVEIALAQQLEAIIEIDGKQQPLVDPTAK